MTPDVAVLAGAGARSRPTPIVAWSRRQRGRRARLPDRRHAPDGAPARAATGARSAGCVRGARVGGASAARADAVLDGRAARRRSTSCVAAVGAGCTPVGAVELAARVGSGAGGRARSAGVLVATELGGSFAGRARPSSRRRRRCSHRWPTCCSRAPSSARPPTGALMRLADEARARARRRAETRARVLPVKLLFPLVFLVLPAFGLLTVAPALLSALSRL